MGETSRYTLDDQANQELTALAADMLVRCRLWLSRYEPDFLAEVGDGQCVDTAVQGLMNAELSRNGMNGQFAVRSLVHGLAIFIAQQPDGDLAFNIIGEMIKGELHSLRSMQTAGNG